MYAEPEVHSGRRARRANTGPPLSGAGCGCTGGAGFSHLDCAEDKDRAAVTPGYADADYAVAVMDGRRAWAYLRW